MKIWNPHSICHLLFVFTSIVLAQETTVIDSVLTYEEYIGYVKQHHPLARQADLRLTTGEATLLEARGGFDPKIDVDYDRKKFKKTEYYDKLNASFKIPTWYGIEFKANYEENSGSFLNPEATVPNDGLYSAGVSVALARGLLMNERMAALRQARFFREQTRAERELLLNTLIYEASLAYFDWLEAANEQRIYQQFLDNAQIRFDGIERSIAVGDKAAIDATEARITLENRKLNIEAANLKKQKAALEASNYLWINEIPVELEAIMEPAYPSQAAVIASLRLDDVEDASLLLLNNPKLRSLEFKIRGLRVNRALKRNNLLPDIGLSYDFLSPQYERVDGFNTANYKAGLTLQVPLFLRKERGALRLANAKLQDANLERLATTLQLQNKVTAAGVEISSLEDQNTLIESIVTDYSTLVSAEERKFNLGESSLFLINSREKSLIDARLKENQLQIKLLDAFAKLYNAIGVIEE